MDPVVFLLCRGYRPHVPLEESVTANQYKAFLSDHVYPKMTSFNTDGAGVLASDDNSSPSMCKVERILCVIKKKKS